MTLVRGWAAVLVVGVGLSGALAGVRWDRERDRVGARLEVERRTPRVGSDGGYVSSDACRACHPDEYASWHRTYHRTMTQVASAESVAAPFAGSVELDGQTYRLERDGERFFMDVPDPVAGGTARARLQVVMVTGSHHMQAFWFHTPTDNRLYLAPLTYLLADQRWVKRGDVFLAGPLAPGEHPLPQVWNQSCIECHATAGQPRPRRDSLSAVEYSDTRVAELGIACEACHGPGAAHVAANQDPLRRWSAHLGDGTDPTIVNPARLPARASALICGACHALFRLRDVADYFENGHRFRPGDAEDPSRILLLPRELAAMPDLAATLLRENPDFLEQSYWRDGRARVSGRDLSGLMESACWHGGELSCLSCHSMHRADPDDQLKPGMDGDQACLGCHAAFAADPSAHTHHRADSSGSRCMNCHMPYTTYGLLGAIRSHTIASPSAGESLETGRPNACNLCHLDRSLAWTEAALRERFGRPAVDVSAAPATSAALDWLLRGDAGQRALGAWSFGWAPAQATAGSEWLAPYLGILLDDPYAAVRYVAARSLRSLPGYADLTYDYVAPEAERRAARDRVLADWKERDLGSPRPALLIGADGRFAWDQIQAILGTRDDRRVDLKE